MTTPAEYAARALLAHAAMERRFRRRDGLYRRAGWLGRIGITDHLWPVARAFTATVDLAGVPAQLTSGFDPDPAIARDLSGLERYWDPRGPLPAYASDLHRTPWSGDRYYDDNAWVGLTLVQLERSLPGRAPAGRAAQLFDFARAGWSTDRQQPWPGGTYWVEQGRGAGRRNHDRNTVSNAPNAQLGLHLDELEGSELRRAGAVQMFNWVHASLRAADGLYFDRVRSDGTVDRAVWSYNQGSMLGAAVLRARVAEDAVLLGLAETIVRVALRRYHGRYFDQAPAFNAIFFRNLLLVHHATSDAELRTEIVTAMNAYADDAWRRRTPDGLLPRANGQATLLDQSALVQVLALSAWDPHDYCRLT